IFKNISIELDRFEKSELLTRKVRNHPEICDWMDEAEEWQVKFAEWERDEKIRNSRHIVVGKLSQASNDLDERYEELSDKKERWEERCSTNLCWYYPKHGFELTDEQYCRM